MHQSNRGSWQAMNFMKGNHRRKGEAAVTSLVLWGKTHNTPSQEEALSNR